MKIYNYDGVSGVFVSESTAQENPKHKGQYLMPPNSTIIPPPSYNKNEIPVFKNSYWKIIPDYRGSRIINTETLELSYMKNIGDLESGEMLYSDYINSEQYKKEQEDLEKQERYSDILQEIKLLDEKRFLENCKQGVTELKPHDLAEGSDTFTIVGGQKFYQSYRKFADDYIKSLKDISEMPQESYNKAVDTILAPKDFIMDFQHTNNTFVDLKNNEFNFMDFVFDKSLYPKYHYDNPVKEFRNVLMGKCFSIEFKTPRQLMIYPEDIAQVKVHSNAINEKVNNASPERFRSRSPFS